MNDQLEMFKDEELHKTQSFTSGNTVTGVNYAVADTIHLTLTTPLVVGYWCPVPNTSISTSKMPSKFHQWMMRLAFGWTFTEVPPSPPKKELLLG